MEYIIIWAICFSQHINLANIYLLPEQIYSPARETTDEQILLYAQDFICSVTTSIVHHRKWLKCKMSFLGAYVNEMF